MLPKIRATVLTVVGVVSIVFAILCFTRDDLSYEFPNYYGGDAFTGIQHAAARTSRNVSELAKIVQFGFGSILLVMGLGFIGVGLTTPMNGHKEENSLPENNQADSPQIDSPIVQNVVKSE